MWKTVPEGRTSKTRSIFLPGARDYGILNPIGVQDSVTRAAPGEKWTFSFSCPPFQDKVQPGEPKRSSYRSPFPGSWTLFKSQDRLRPRGLTSRPETVLLESRSRESETSALFRSPGPPCDVEDCPGRPDIENEVHLLARSKGLRNPEPLWGSGFP